MDHNQTRANYDQLSRWYELFSAPSERAARLRGLQILNVQPGERVLEIGCGTGVSLPALASPAGPTGRVVGLDLSAGMLDLAKHKLEKLALRQAACLQADAVWLPFPDESFEVVWMSFTLELFSAPEIPGLLQECRRALCPGGRLGIVALSKKEKPGWMERAYGWAHHRWPQVIDCRPIPLEAVVKSADFEIVHSLEMWIWSLAVGLLVAVKTSPK